MLYTACSAGQDLEQGLNGYQENSKSPLHAGLGLHMQVHAAEILR